MRIEVRRRAGDERGHLLSGRPAHLAPVVRRCLLMAYCAVLIAGCGSAGLDGTIPVSGRVVYQGKPLAAGEVRYMPEDDARGRVARGRLDSDGQFTLTTLTDGDGALPGDYRVVVLLFPDDVRSDQDQDGRGSGAASTAPPIPLRYYSPETSGLSDTVNRDHPGYREFELTEQSDK